MNSHRRLPLRIFLQWWEVIPLHVFPVGFLIHPRVGVARVATAVPDALHHGVHHGAIAAVPIGGVLSVRHRHAH